MGSAILFLWVCLCLESSSLDKAIFVASYISSTCACICLLAVSRRWINLLHRVSDKEEPTPFRPASLPPPCPADTTLAVKLHNNNTLSKSSSCIQISLNAFELSRGWDSFSKKDYSLFFEGLSMDFLEKDSCF